MKASKKANIHQGKKVSHAKAVKTMVKKMNTGGRPMPKKMAKSVAKVIKRK
jgi:hypothetical protein